MSQGFTEAPFYMSQVLNQDLKDLTSPCDSVVVQYVDDVLLCSDNKETYDKGAIYLLCLSKNGT